MIHYHDSNVFDLVVSDITKYLLRAFVKVWIRPKFIYTDPSVQRRKGSSCKSFCSTAAASPIPCSVKICIACSSACFRVMVIPFPVFTIR